MADFQAKSSQGAKNEKNGAILDFAKILHQDNFECGESIRNSPMADFQAKSSRGAKNEQNGAIFDLAKILHQDKFECGESIKNSPNG